MEGRDRGWRQVGVDSNTYYLNKASMQGRLFKWSQHWGAGGERVVKREVAQFYMYTVCMIIIKTLVQRFIKEYLQRRILDP
jgi:hypothetical protein